MPSYMTSTSSASVSPSPSSSPLSGSPNSSPIFVQNPESFTSALDMGSSAPLLVPADVLDEFNRYWLVEDDMLFEDERLEKVESIKQGLPASSRQLEDEVRYQLQLGSGDSCGLAGPSAISNGRFNINTTFNVVKNGEKGKYRLRLPIPAAHNEGQYPGSVEEKIRVDVGSQVWWEKNMIVKTAELVGFGFPYGGARVTHKDYVPVSEVEEARGARLEDIQVEEDETWVSDYIPRPTINPLSFGYLLYKVVDDADSLPLLKSMASVEDTVTQDAKIIRSVAKLVTELTKNPLSRIGSFRFHDDGTVTLSNRPLFSALTLMELNGAQRLAPSRSTLDNTREFVGYMLDQQSSRFARQRNAVNGEEDCRRKMSLGAFMREMVPTFLEPELNQGPFLVQMMDLDISHIMVNAEWDITSIVDLEWLSVLPLEVMQEAPWLTGMLVEREGASFLTHDEGRRMWLRILGEEEIAMWASGALSPERCLLSISAAMERMHRTGGFWFGAALTSHNGMYDEVEDNLVGRHPHEWSQDLYETLYEDWDPSNIPLARQKLNDMMAYMRDVRDNCTQQLGGGEVVEDGE